MSRKLFSFSAVVLVLGQWLFCQSQPGVAVTGTYVMQPSAPVQITSLTKSLQDQLAAVTVTNKSEKTVTSFRLGWTVGIPQPCSAAVTAPAITRQMAVVDRIELNPNESATTKDYRLSTEGLVAKVKHQKGVLIDFQVAVMEVTFSDGSTWNAAFPENDMFDAADFEFWGTSCNGGKLKPEALQSSFNPNSGPPATSTNSNTQEAPISASLSTPKNPPLVSCKWTCTTYPAPIYCTNNDTTCTNSGCSDPSNCARQICSVQGC